MGLFKGTSEKCSSADLGGSNYGFTQIAIMRRPYPAFGHLWPLWVLVALFASCIAGVALAEETPAPDVSSTMNSMSAADSSVAVPLRVVLFYCPTCGESKEAMKALAASAERWGSRIRIERKDVGDPSVFNELLIYEKHCGSRENAPPKAFLGDQYIAGGKAIANRLDDAIAQELSTESITFFPLQAAGEKGSVGQETVPPDILSRFQNFSIGAVAVAGLVDGVNPCAFTTIVFFLSMLTYLGKSKRELIVVGIGFTATMFVTYFLLGLGLLGAIKSFSVSHGISSGLACGVSVLAFVLAGWSFWDFVQYKRTGDVKKVTLGLPKPIKQRIHKVIRAGLTTRGLVVGSITVGFLVSILESLCTGMAYLPTIVFVTRAPGLQLSAVAYLLLYNLMFIVPLVGFLVIAYMGVKSDMLGDFLRRHLATFKLATAALFAALGFIVFVTI